MLLMQEKFWKNDRSGNFKLEYNLENITAKIEKKKKINKFIKTIISIILILIFLINAKLLYYNLNGDKTPKILRYVFFQYYIRQYGT